MGLFTEVGNEGHLGVCVLLNLLLWVYEDPVLPPVVAIKSNLVKAFLIIG